MAKVFQRFNLVESDRGDELNEKHESARWGATKQAIMKTICSAIF